MDFKINDDDFIDYNIFPTESNLSETELSEFRDSCLNILAPYIVDYLWHLDPFHLQVIMGRVNYG